MATVDSPSSPLSEAPSLAGVLAAAEAIAPLLPVTPAWSYPSLNAVAGREVVLKHENAQPTGAFKVRGGLALAATLAAAETHLVTASTGNHAQSIAYAAAASGRQATIVMPTSAPENTVSATQALGATVITAGATMTEAVAHAERLAAQHGWRFVDPGNEPAILHGHATATLELLRARPDLTAVYVPIGSGTGAAGACLVRDALAPECAIIGVQSRQAPAAYRAWSSGEPATAPCETRSSGLATAASFAMTQRILGARLDDFLLVDDDDIDRARRLLATHAHTLAEGAGAAALAGALARRDARAEARGPIGVIVSGGNADDRELASLA
jgi:threonine dehydratase